MRCQPDFLIQQVYCPLFPFFLKQRSVESYVSGCCNQRPLSSSLYIVRVLSCTTFPNQIIQVFQHALHEPCGCSIRQLFYILFHYIKEIWTIKKRRTNVNKTHA